MNNKQLRKFLSLILRHRPEVIDIPLDEYGWADTQHLLQQLQQKDQTITLEQLQEVVATNDKQRFRFSEDGNRIKANQGHSIAVELELKPQLPPAQLYHGTAKKFLSSIQAQGILKGKRHHVHLSADIATAQKVGSRHGKVVVLVIDTARMLAAEKDFFCSENGVWLTDYVAPEYFELLN